MLNDLFIESPISGVSLITIDLPQLDWSLPTESKLPIGKRFEAQVISHYKNANRYTILAENLQIIENGVTLGELDLIVRDNRDQSVWHIEMVRKFYRYEPSLLNQGLYPWMGPADRDHLSRKCSRLKEHQFPMLQNRATQECLRKLDIDTREIHQGLLFKADLFHLAREKPVLSPELNADAIHGELHYFEELDALNRDHQYHICHRQEWLMAASLDAKWLNYEDFMATIKLHHDYQQALMIWRKKSEEINTSLIVPSPKPNT